ncbi:MAG: DUF4296 domain-containing protein [Bacteroidota bacterium]|nr:DUF4296 domain-containing protein [Bacteroidota bacterium]
MSACSSKSDRPSSEVISVSELQLILPDLMTIEAEISGLTILPDSIAKLKIYRYDQVCARHGITKHILIKSLDYYLKKPVIIDDAFLVTLDSLNAMEGRYR